MGREWRVFLPKVTFARRLYLVTFASSITFARHPFIQVSTLHVQRVLHDSFFFLKCHFSKESHFCSTSIFNFFTIVTFVKVINFAFGVAFARIEIFTRGHFCTRSHCCTNRDFCTKRHFTRLIFMYIKLSQRKYFF